MDKTNKNTNLASFYFHQGTNYYAYEYLGCHESIVGEKHEYTFRVWAPNADSVMLVSDFTSWDVGLQMQCNESDGVWEVTFSSNESLIGKCYKFKIWNHGRCFYKADPYAFHSETLNKTASVVANIDGFDWTDENWFKFKGEIFKKNKGTDSEKYYNSAPVNIYEMNLASWKRRSGCQDVYGKYLTYTEIANELAPYLKKMGYTHVELMPIMEHPYDGSWGYQVSGYYAPTSRFGKPQEFMYFVNKMHEAGIGVILDWVPAHFPKDEHGLYEFDGQPLYEYQGNDRKEHKVWGTRFFDLGREEIQSFLVSNALFWFRKYHIDGLRVDAVASMLYLDFDKDPGEWVPNDEGTNKNKEAIAFLKKLNSAIFCEFEDALMIAEESTDWPTITKPVGEGGLGFNYKWNMGWANDMYEYVSQDPIYRKYSHDKLTFPMMYAFNENYIYPISHDEVVHGKKSLIDKMFGAYDDKFNSMRAFMTYMMCMPGKKMTFMGTEFAQFREWDYENQLEWFMTDYQRHNQMQKFIADLNNFYLSSKQLWEIDNSWDGYEWIEANESEWNIISFKRKAIDKSELIVVVNFSPVSRENYTVKVDLQGKYEEIFNTDQYKYGGRGVINSKCLQTSTYKNDFGEEQNYFNINLPQNGAVILRGISGKARRE